MASCIFSSNMHVKGTDAKPVVDGSITIADKTNLTVVLPQQDPAGCKTGWHYTVC